MELNMIRKINRCFLAIACAVALSSCKTVPIVPTDPECKGLDASSIIQESFDQYVELQADGADINAMLSYCSLEFYLRTPTSWEGDKELVNNYLTMASTEYISPNYTLLAGSNEVTVVSNFLIQVICYLESNRVTNFEVPSQISSFSQDLIISIHNSEYEKNE
jgi:hypothetical protein